MMKPIYRIWDRLAWRHLAPKKGSVEELASLHLFVNEHRDKTVTVGDKQLPASPHIVACLDGMIDQARRKNDVRFLRRYARAVGLVASSKPLPRDLTYLAMSAWWKLHTSLGRIPTPREVKTQVMRESRHWFTERHWLRVMQELAELFEPSPDDWQL
ncbi:MAG: hypothetical protein WBW78_22295 [Terrimicrobiaceae bacterium]